jgi:basic amino acid/polyamine antiporter, APA family
MTKLKKEIKAFGVFSIASGAMISSGIFILPGLAFTKVGSGLYISYLLAGFLGLVGILSMIELATAMPKAGGDYYYINRSFGPLIGSISGFLGWFALTLKSSFAVFGISQIISIYFEINPLVSGLVLCLLFVTLNILGAREATVFQILMVLALLALMIIYIFSGIPHINREHFVITKEIDINSIIITSGFIFISFGGLLKVASISEEVSNPKKNLPKGMISSIAVVTVLYVLMIIVMTGTLDAETFSSSLTPVADSAKITLGSLGYNVILIASVLAFVTTANAGVMAASRYPLALSIDKLIPSVLGRVSPRTGTPTLAILITGVLIYLSLLLPLETLVKAASTVILSSYVLTNLSVIIFRESKLTNYSPSFRAPFYPWLQILAVLIFTFFIIDLGLSAIEISIALFLIGFIAYFIYGRRRSRKESALFHLMRRIADDRLINETIEDDFREIIIDRDNIEQDNFDRLLKKAKIIDLEGEYDFQTMLKIVVRDIAREVDMPEAEIRSRFEARQESDNTALSDFLAIPHIIIEGEDKMFMYVIRSRDGIRFTEDYESIKAIFLLGGTKDVKVLHLKTIAAIASLISEHGFEKSWMKAESTVDLKNLLLINERRRYH